MIAAAEPVGGRRLERLRERRVAGLALRRCALAGRGGCRRRSRGGSWMFGSSDDRRHRESRPTRNGRRSALGQIQHADDVRRQRQDDVGLLRFLVMCREQPPDHRQVAQAGHS